MIIGISGKKQHGKDTLGGIIKKFAFEIKQKEFRNKKFADKLKEIVSMLTGIPKDLLEQDEVKNSPLGPEWDFYEVSPPPIFKRRIFFTKDSVENFVRHCNTWDNPRPKYFKKQMTPRLMLQLMGTEAGREIIHPNIWINSLFSEYNEESNWIVTDVRFPNEAEAIKEKGGILIRINRPSMESDDTHLSETALDHWPDWDRIIVNEEFDHLKTQAQNIVREFL